MARISFDDVPRELRDELAFQANFDADTRPDRRDDDFTDEELADMADDDRR